MLTNNIAFFNYVTYKKLLMKMSYSSNYFKVITVLATLMFYYVSCSNSTENSSTTTENTNVAKTNATQNVIWPGDADNNGVVSTEDILSIGLKYNKRGKERAANQRNTRFEKYTSTPWGERLPNEADISHIDCDGNGIIDNADMSAIAANFTNTVPTATTNDSFKPQGTIGMLLKKVSSTRYSCEEKGKICYKNIYNMDLLKEENIYGANFILNYQARIGVGITIKSVKITNSCLGTEGDDFISITKFSKPFTIKTSICILK